jgi:hypothetical protein
MVCAAAERNNTCVQRAVQTTACRAEDFAHEVGVRVRDRRGGRIRANVRVDGGWSIVDMCVDGGWCNICGFVHGAIVSQW